MKMKMKMKMKMNIKIKMIIPTSLLHRTHFNRTLFSARRHEFDHDDISSFCSISSNPLFSLLRICPNVCSLKIIHSVLITHGISANILFQTKLLSLYASFGHVEDARLVFDNMPDPDFYSYKVMLRWYFLHEMHPQLIKLYRCLRERHNEFDNFIFSVLLKACSELGDVDVGRKIHGEIVKAGNPDSFVLTGLVDMYSKCEELGFARRVFDETVDKNVVCWTSLISGYVQNDFAEEGLILFNRMRNDQLVEINDYTLGILAVACTKLVCLHQGKWIHGLLIKKGMVFNSFLLTTLVDMYVKCRTIDDARRVFDKVPTVDLVLWTAMIAGYTHNDRPFEALKLFSTHYKLFLPNSFTISTILSACGQCFNLSLGRSIHAVEVKLAFDNDPTVVNALVDMYAKCHTIVDARLVFDTTSNKNLITWNSMISGYYLNGYHYEAVRLFNEMRQCSENLSPDAISLVIILSAFASIGALELGSSVHGCSIKVGLSSSNVYVGTALVNLYAKCGDVGSARVVFEGMREKNAITWSSIIGGCGMVGDAIGCLSLYSNYISEGVNNNNNVIFTTVLSACSHAGKLIEGLSCFKSITVPSEKHYVCVVDGLARAGRLEEAWDFMERTGGNGINMLAAFLHGCCLYNSRFDLGKEVANRMVKLRPEEASYYLLLSNFYTKCGDLNKADEVREVMKKQRLTKSPGYSRQ